MEFKPFEQCIKESRRSLKISREDLAKKLGILESTLRGWEVGRIRRATDPKFFVKLAKALNWTGMEKDHMQELYEIGMFWSKKSKFHSLFKSEEPVVIEFLYRFYQARPERRVQALESAIKSLRGQG